MSTFAVLRGPAFHRCPDAVYHRLRHLWGPVAPVQLNPLSVDEPRGEPDAWLVLERELIEQWCASPHLFTPDPRSLRGAAIAGPRPRGGPVIPPPATAATAGTILAETRHWAHLLIDEFPPGRVELLGAYARPVTRALRENLPPGPGEAVGDFAATLISATVLAGTGRDGQGRGPIERTLARVLRDDPPLANHPILQAVQPILLESGLVILPGDSVVMGLSAANRHHRGRSPLVFGAGRYTCTWSGLAQEVALSAVVTLLRRLPHLRYAYPGIAPRWVESPLWRVPETLPCLITPEHREGAHPEAAISRPGVPVLAPGPRLTRPGPATLRKGPAPR